jgi:hypothetical protein
MPQVRDRIRGSMAARRKLMALADQEKSNEDRYVVRTVGTVMFTFGSS